MVDVSSASHRRWNESVDGFDCEIRGIREAIDEMVRGVAEMHDGENERARNAVFLKEYLRN